MKKTLRFTILVAIMSLTSWLANAQALPLNACDYKEGMPCFFIGPSQSCRWLDGQAGACVCVDRDHYECVRF